MSLDRQKEENGLYATRIVLRTMLKKKTNLANITCIIEASSGAGAQNVPPEIGGKWGTECLNTRFPLPTLLCAGYCVKLKKTHVSQNIVDK